MNPTLPLSLIAVAATAAASRADLTGYWPLDEAGGTVAPNLAAGGTNGDLFNGATWVTDAERGQVLQFDGNNGYVNAGTIPALGNADDFTWSFWANNSQGTNSNVVVGNRYSPTTGVDFSPREFVKFTTNQFEWHRNNSGENLNYADIPNGSWIHHATSKNGQLLTYYRDGLAAGNQIVTQGTNNAQPLYFGGDQTNENWAGRLDDVGTWTGALGAYEITQIAQGIVSPAGAVAVPYNVPQFTDGFSGGSLNPADWTVTTRGLENNAPAGYNAPTVAGDQLGLGGTTSSQFWFGSSIESTQRFDASVATEISVDRVSLSGSGSAYRSSLWIYGDAGHYLHFSQNFGENGWQFNANDAGGAGTSGPTGGGNNLSLFDFLDGDLGAHEMAIRAVPTGLPGQLNFEILLDGNLGWVHSVTNFPADYAVILTGQARAGGDSVLAVFDNFSVATVPEPSRAFLLALGLAGAFLRRRR